MTNDPFILRCSKCNVEAEPTDFELFYWGALISVPQCPGKCGCALAALIAFPGHTVPDRAVQLFDKYAREVEQ